MPANLSVGLAEKSHCELCKITSCIPIKSDVYCMNGAGMRLDKSVICPVFIGRENDLQLLDRLIMQSGDKSGQIALISGEAGIGKSRLVKETKARVSKGALILEGHCFQTESALPYAPILDLFRTFFAINSGEEIARALGLFAPELVKLIPELIGHLPNLSSNPNLDPKQEKRRLFQALVQTLTEFAQSQPLVIIIEDLHWSDSTSLEFLLLLARRISSQPILLIVTYRSEETTPELTHFLAELDRERLGAEFELKRMSPMEVDAMLRAILDLKTPISKELLETIFPLTEGNPFFIEEILKALIVNGDIFYADGTWDRKEINPLQIPRTIQDAVQRRTQQLDEHTLQALTLAAVMGRRFDFRLLQELLEVNEEELTAMLKRLVKAQLVVEESVDQYSFRHALTREAVYTSLMLRERQEMHRKIGEAIEKLHEADLNPHLADLSYHFYTGGVWQKALEYSRQAGDQAHELYAQREAIVYYSRALVSARQLKMIIEPELLRARGNAYEILGDFRSALDDFEQALQIAREHQDGKAEWQTLINLGFLWAGRDYQEAGVYYQRASEIARKLEDSVLLGHSLNRLGNWYVNVGKPGQALQIHHEALELFENRENKKGIAETHDLLGMANFIHGDLVKSELHYTQAVQLFRELNYREGLASTLPSMILNGAHFQSGMAVLAQTDRRQILPLGEEALKIAREIGWRSAEAYALICLSMYFGVTGNYARAFEFAKPVFPSLRKLNIVSGLHAPNTLWGYIISMYLH